jgi:hypothetical protein
VAATKVWLGFWKPQSVEKVGKNSLYDKWAIWIVMCGSSKVWQAPNTCQIAKFWLGKVWLGTKQSLSWFDNVILKKSWFANV